MFFKKLSLVTGGFEPIHSGHISYFTRAKDFSDYLVVGINTEQWLTNKKGQYFQSWVERAEIIRHLDMVDAVRGNAISSGGSVLNFARQSSIK